MQKNSYHTSVVQRTKIRSIKMRLRQFSLPKLQHRLGCFCQVFVCCQFSLVFCAILFWRVGVNSMFTVKNEFKIDQQVLVGLQACSGFYT